MESFVVDVAPPLSRLNLTATTEDLHKHPEYFFAGSDIVWMLISSALVLLMVPAMCLFYSGASDRRLSLTLFRLPLITAALVGFQWYLWGYSLAFTPAVHPPSPGKSWYGGDPSGNALHDSLARPTGADGAKIPELLYQFYEGMFASFTAALVCGGTMREHHVTVGRFLVFITFWSLLVYNPVARWSWHWAGWSNQYDVMDFAGGTAVHITSGTAVLAFYVFYELDTKGFKRCLEGSWRIFKRRLTKPFVLLGALRKQSSGPPLRIIQPGDEDDNESEAHELENRSSNSHVQAPKESNTTNGQDDPEAGQTVPPEEQPARLGLGPEADKPPHNVNNMILGTALLWIGWFGFNGGSALGGNLRAVSACVSTHVAACAGGTTSLFFFWIWNVLARWTAEDDDAHRVPSVSATHFCDGAVIGLVAITPAAGFVPVWSAGVFGVVSAVVVTLLKKFTRGMLTDEPLFVFSIHAGGGMVGMFLTGCFADPAVVGLDGYSKIPDRTVAGRLRYQMLDAFAGLFYTFFTTLAILYGLKTVRSIAIGKWMAPVFGDAKKNRRWKLEATPQHAWRDTA